MARTMFYDIFGYSHKQPLTSFRRNREHKISSADTNPFLISSASIWPETTAIVGSISGSHVWNTPRKVRRHPDDLCTSDARHPLHFPRIRSFGPLIFSSGRPLLPCLRLLATLNSNVKSSFSRSICEPQQLSLVAVFSPKPPTACPRSAVLTLNNPKRLVNTTNQ